MPWRLDDREQALIVPEPVPEPGPPPPRQGGSLRRAPPVHAFLPLGPARGPALA
jgi:hypothetical protein